MFSARTANKSFLSHMLQAPLQRAFSSRVAIQNFIQAEEATQAAERANTINPNYHSKEYQKLQAYSQTYLKKKQEDSAAEAEWFSKLRSPQQKEGIFA